jgi:hypothetical protein
MPTTAPDVLVEANRPAGFPAPGPIGEVIVKQYPACREVISAASPGESDQMFESLFKHISSKRIPMTSPVVITWTADGPPREHSMAFVYGSPATGKVGTDGDLQVADEPAMTVLSVGVRGGYDSEHFQAGMKQIQTFLAGHAGDYFVDGPPRYLGYNSPFVPAFMRYGEVQIPVARR